MNIDQLELRDGRRYAEGDLDLSGTAITSLPDDLSVGGKIYKYF